MTLTFKKKRKEKTNGEACQNTSLALPLSIFTSLLSLASCQVQRCASTHFHVPGSKQHVRAEGHRRGPSSFRQSVKHGVPEHQVVHVAQCLNVPDPRQEHRRHTQPVTARQRD